MARQVAKDEWTTVLVPENFGAPLGMLSHRIAQEKDPEEQKRLLAKGEEMTESMVKLPTKFTRGKPIVLTSVAA